MPARAVLAVAGVLLVHCSRSSSAVTAGEAGVHQDSGPNADMPPPRISAAKPVGSRKCVVGAPVTVTEGRGGVTFSIAASTRGVLVTWGELRRAAGDLGLFPPQGSLQRFEVARTFDADTLAPRGPAQEVGRQAAVDARSNGVAAFALADGTLGAATCAWEAYAGHLECRAGPPSDGPFVGTRYQDPHVMGPGPEGDRLAAAPVGDAALILLPQCRDVRAIAAAMPAAHFLVGGVGEDDPSRLCDGHDIDVPAIAALGRDEAAGVWRNGAVLEGRLIGKDGVGHGSLVKVSTASSGVGAPAIAWTGSEALVVFAARTGAAPYSLVLAHWKPGTPIARTPLSTGSEPAMAPAIVATEDATCSLVSWTEGRGSATHARSGLVCADAVVEASLVDVSTPGVEAGDTELARIGGSSSYVVWQELPRGHLPELRLAKVICE